MEFGYGSLGFVTGVFFFLGKISPSFYKEIGDFFVFFSVNSTNIDFFVK
jgi:hypothetical protein